MSHLRDQPPPPVWPLPDAAVEAALRSAFADGSWGKYHGPNCRELSDRLAALHGCEHVVLTCSGTAAVELALHGLKVGTDDEVILSAYDFEGNFKNVLMVGAKPVLVDVDERTGQLDVSQLEAARSSRTKAIIASHLHGGVVAMPAVRAFADQHGIAVIEDACQMPGAIVHGRVAGTWGDVGVLSFGGSKLLTAGRGGALVTRDGEIAQRIRVHTQRGNDAYPLSELQAAVLVPQLDRLVERNQLRAENVSRLLALLSDVAGLRCFVDAAGSGDPRRTQGDPRRAPSVAAHTMQPGFYKLGFWFDAVAFGCSREDFACAMRAKGIALDPGFRALHRTHARGRFRAVNELANATRADESILVLHHPVLLGTAGDMQAIRDAINS
ncbi:MAG: aminotransferase class V-fold PLP-dependent enzyme [Planctomycetaceae bacterium]|nr:aminotransferase class V-fold PLP-dependent enzyme [Planctomycetaceae bacterium]